MFPCLLPTTTAHSHSSHLSSLTPTSLISTSHAHHHHHNQLQLAAVVLVCRRRHWMAKLVVEVLDASDLMPKDGEGSASAYVEVEYDEQRQRTRTKNKDLNPAWNERLIFGVNHPDEIVDKTVYVAVYNDRGSGNEKNFLGRVRISGVSVAGTEEESEVRRYPLDKRRPFSHVKGDIALKMYLLDDPNDEFTVQDQRESHVHEEVKERDENKQETPLQEINTNASVGDQEESRNHDSNKKKKSKKAKEVRSFYSIPQANAHTDNPTRAVPPERPPPVEIRTQFMRSGPPGPPNTMFMQVPPRRPEFELVETRPPVAARMGYRGGDKMSNTYDLVEQMQYLYVRVVKARDLPDMDTAGGLDPYVEVKLGNYKGITKYFEKNQNPVWNKTFAFSKEKLQAHQLEVTVKNKDVGKDDFVGRVAFDLTEVPIRQPPDSPLAPQWYRLEDKRGDKSNRGEIMLAIWLGTQADEAFPEAWHSDAHSIGHQNLTNTRSKVYFSPRLYYLRVNVIEAQDLVASERGHLPLGVVKVQVANQMKTTRMSPIPSINPMWNEELLFVVSEPFEDFIVISVNDRKDEVLGRTFIPVREIPQRIDSAKIPDARWFNLFKPASPEEEGEKKEVKFSSKIHLRLSLDSGYHVLDESTHFSSDLQPSAKILRKPSIGVLELGILSARNLLPMKGKEGRLTDAYCVAKYGHKWVRTRTLLDSLAPRWNEQYTWEVHDPCTVITIGVLDNCHLNGGKQDARDQRIGKVRIRLSTLETDRVYTHYYPLWVLQPSGLQKNGELQLAIRFTCTARINMVTQYGKPLLPKMHYVQPIPVRYIDQLRHQATQIIAARLARAEPPLWKEAVEYMLDVDYHMWSMRKSKANFQRITSLLSGMSSMFRWFNDVCRWRNPVTTVLVHVLFLILICYPELILPTIFLYLFMIGVWNYRFRPRYPPHMDARLSQADTTTLEELDEEFDTFPTSRPPDIVRIRYDRMRVMGGRLQTVMGDLATQMERFQALLSWRDPRATAIFIILSLISAIMLYVTPFQVIALLFGLYCLRHPRFRIKQPSVPVNFFKRLPAKADMLL